MALTREEKSRAAEWIIFKAAEVGVDLGRPDQMIEFMIDHPVPSQSAIEAELATSEATEKAKRIANLRKQLNALEGR